MRVGIAVLCLCALLPFSAAASTPEKQKEKPVQSLRAVQPPPGAQNRAQNCEVVECEPPDPSPWSCQETDNGNSPFAQGTLFFLYYDILYYTYNDYCSNSSWVVEYWCNSSSSWTTTSFYCVNGCSGGRCL